jgi:predicted nucleic acid-binding protein
MRRIVLDTNVLVSSLLVRAGLPARVLDGWRQRQYLLVTSPAHHRRGVHRAEISPDSEQVRHYG